MHPFRSAIAMLHSFQHRSSPTATRTGSCTHQQLSGTSATHLLPQLLQQLLPKQLLHHAMPLTTIGAARIQALGHPTRSLT
jgi:hypothetical protein